MWQKARLYESAALAVGAAVLFLTVAVAVHPRPGVLGDARASPMNARKVMLGMSTIKERGGVHSLGQEEEGDWTSDVSSFLASVDIFSCGFGGFREEPLLRTESSRIRNAQQRRRYAGRRTADHRLAMCRPGERQSLSEDVSRLRRASVSEAEKSPTLAGTIAGVVRRVACRFAASLWQPFASPGRHQTLSNWHRPVGDSYDRAGRSTGLTNRANQRVSSRRCSSCRAA